MVADTQLETVKNPKLTLIAFQLRNILQSGDEPIETSDHLWEKCRELGIKLGSPQLKDLIKQIQKPDGKIDFASTDNNSDHIPLLKPDPDTFLYFYGKPDANYPQIQGGVYPLQIHDTYAVDITFYRPEAVVKVSELQTFINPHNCLNPDFIQSDLGQTLLFWAEPMAAENKSDRHFLNACIRGLFPTPEAELLLKHPPSEGQLFGSPIFEYQTPTNHLLIWLNNSPETQQLESQGVYYEPLINLLCCRHKILYAYRQSRWCNQQAKQLYQQLSPHLKILEELPEPTPPKLEILKQELTKLPRLSFKYFNHIQEIKLHLNTIETNLKNYQTCVKELEDIALPEDDLPFLHEFQAKARSTFIEQIEVDLEYLIPGQDLFSELINTIRGLVEIEQTECDRSLEHTIQILGAGLGAGGIVASAVSGHIEQGFLVKDDQNQYILNPGISALFWSLFVFLLVGGVVGSINGGLLEWYNNYLKKR
ncbi:hypothetical protein [Limnospira indica]|uniref:hypothetical protein n=1 Tax=Limnospira indica TaxID=147322 RepID=UPI00185FE11C|nr:hypothetical protein [Limnospira indica]QNH57477.1 MAG: hypothetical protein H2674_25910 [Limnospira indica BM01]